MYGGPPGGPHLPNRPETFPTSTRFASRAATHASSGAHNQCSILSTVSCAHHGFTLSLGGLCMLHRPLDTLHLLLNHSFKTSVG